MGKSLRDDFETVSPMRGMFVGILGDEQVAAFDRLVEAGVAYRGYEGAAGLLGLSKIKFHPNAIGALLTRLEASEPGE